MIYIASKSKHGQRWRALRDQGVPVCSTWIDEYDDVVKNADPDLWARCIREASTATAFIMYVESGEVHKGSLVELGAALSHGVPVYWVGPEVGTVRRAKGIALHTVLESALDDIFARGQQHANVLTDSERENDFNFGERLD